MAPNPDQTPVIAGYVRTPFHFAKKGALAKVRPDDLAVVAIKALVAKTGVKPEDIEDLLLGCAFPEGEQGINIARAVALLAGLPKSVGGATLNRWCASSMSTIHMAAGSIAAGSGQVFIAGGVESMTRVPMGGFNPMPNPAMDKGDLAAYMSMGLTAENVAKKYQISRADQEAFAVNSHMKAAKAWADGNYADEVTSVDANGVTVDKDGCVRPDTNAEALAGLKPAFDAEGSVTAGTSSPLTDGATATLVTSEGYAKANGLPVLARIKGMAVTGCEPAIMGIGPVPATQKLLDRHGLKVDDVDIFELNEAFASQSLAVQRDLSIPDEKINIDGGAIALGHPLGASGARITGKAALLLKREGKGLAVSTLCVGGGQGVSTLLEAV
ncbi:MAG TPA: acetyl-CoA C-acyltransferase [Rhodospirillaceae bacterium]|nr:acetyl-CoA C-acyltransferase [Alphaproteobacteria bacterium]OUT41661.1 MAG: acetyl-CoA acetyltransferase [Micavibrio sp. TMED2]HCI46506.1 acetyl-CoA C-acyltransferase [Rhodospirillaceae bacterium]MAS46768.1 acetyl-CoA C-acyltransferase [Alphaproteobacteria bacterium]MAX94863.1 acetyl-CoA C-acyltransferase [Alphaproteobacteria bacterium]|tara:strand:+ start:12276 stop:13427 length:1152 start_codon:yes stop_codon:yes gene_type:complete